MQRVLVIAPNWIGDALMAQPLFALLKKLHPHIVIDALAPGWVAPVLRRMPEINEVRAVDLAHGKLQLWRRWQVANDLRRVGYDAAYVLPNSLKSALIPWLAKIGLRVGYTGERRYGLLNIRHANPSKDERVAMSPHYAALAYLPRPESSLPDLAKTLPTPRLEIRADEAAAVSARFGLDPRMPLVIFCPGAEYGSAKRWPPEHFAALARIIAQSFPYTQIIMLGSAKDALTAQAITGPNVRNLCGQTSLDEACTLISRANAVVSNDSGLMHVTAALERPLVAVYGSTDPRHTPPLSKLAKVQWLHLECSPCFQRECPLGHLNCLQELKAEQVFDDLRGMLLGKH